MTFALILFSAQVFAIPVVLHGYQDRNECERSATFIDAPDVHHLCVPERYTDQSHE